MTIKNSLNQTTIGMNVRNLLMSERNQNKKYMLYESIYIMYENNWNCCYKSGYSWRGIGWKEAWVRGSNEGLWGLLMFWFLIQVLVPWVCSLCGNSESDIFWYLQFSICMLYSNEKYLSGKINNPREEKVREDLMQQD